jgi:hypothetical protein
MNFYKKEEDLNLLSMVKLARNNSGLKIYPHMLNMEAI